MATKLNFLQYTYRIRINHKTLYSQTFPGPHFGSWTTMPCRPIYCPTSELYRYDEIPLRRHVDHSISIDIDQLHWQMLVKRHHFDIVPIKGDIVQKARAVPWKRLHLKMSFNSIFWRIRLTWWEIRHDLSVSNISLAYIYIYILYSY